MNLLDVIVEHLTTATAEGSAVLLDDPHGLVPLASDGDEPPSVEPFSLLPARGNLEFRARYEAVRQGGARLLVVRQRRDVFLPDIEAQAQAAGSWLQLTPREVLAWATGRDDIPAWLDGEAALLRSAFSPVVRALKSAHGAEGELDALLLKAVCGLDIARAADPADAWLAIFRNEALLRGLHRQRSRVAQRLSGWLSRQLPPLSWLSLDDPTPAVRLTWLAALLQPHLDDLPTRLPQVYPGAQRLQGEDATRIARVAYRLERVEPELARRQLEQAEAVLDGPLRDAIVRRLGLGDPATAARLLRRETRSGHLMLMALRTHIGAVATDSPAHELGLEPDLEHLAARADTFSHADAVRHHARLLLALLRLDRVRRSLRRLSGLSSPGAILRRALALFVDAEVFGAEDDIAAVRGALTDNAVADPRWDPQADPERHKAVMAALYHRLQLAEENRAELQRQVNTVLLTGAESAAGPGRVDRAWDEIVTPLRREHGQPRTTLVLVAGLSWAAWERTAGGPLANCYDVATRALLAPLPTLGPWALRRAVAGARWRPELARAEWPELMAACRPELDLRPAKKPLAAWQPVAEQGLLTFCFTSGPLHVVGVDLLAGRRLGGQTPERHAQRLAALEQALLALASSRRRDEMVVVMSVGGCALSGAASEGVPGVPRSPRCLLSGAAPREVRDTVQVAADAVGYPAEPDASLLLAAGAQRLVLSLDEPVLADGGASLAEVAAPLAVLTPVPAGERSTVRVSGLVVPERLMVGEPAELAVYATLMGGALTEVATLECDLPEVPAAQATLDVGERRRLALEIVPALPPDERSQDLTMEVRCRVGRRTFRRRALCTVVARDDAPAGGNAAAAAAVQGTEAHASDERPALRD